MDDSHSRSHMENLEEDKNEYENFLVLPNINMSRDSNRLDISSNHSKSGVSNHKSKFNEDDNIRVSALDLPIIKN